MFELLLGWAALVGISVFVMYVRDPYAAGKHGTRFDALVRKVRSGLQSVCNGLRARGLCPMS